MSEIHLTVHNHETPTSKPTLVTMKELDKIVDAIESCGYSAYMNDNGTIIFTRD